MKDAQKEQSEMRPRVCGRDLQYVEAQREPEERIVTLSNAAQQSSYKNIMKKCFFLTSDISFQLEGANVLCLVPSASFVFFFFSLLWKWSDLSYLIDKFGEQIGHVQPESSHFPDWE